MSARAYKVMQFSSADEFEHGSNSLAEAGWKLESWHYRLGGGGKDSIVAVFEQKQKDLAKRMSALKVAYSAPQGSSSSSAPLPAKTLYETKK